MNLNLARLAMLALSAAIAGSSFAALTPYSQNFEGMSLTNPTALSADGWKVFGNVFTGSGAYIGGYGPFGAPNGGAGFSAVATGEGGPAQGERYINTYNDYNNGDHNNPDRRIEANVFQEQIIGAADLGKTYEFKFDYKASSQFGPGGQTVTQAFIKVLNPTNFNLVAFPVFNTTSASTTAWGTQTLSLTIDSSWTNHIFQFGFMSTANSYQPSGVFYDNINFGQAVPEPATMAALGAGVLVAIRRRRK